MSDPGGVPSGCPAGKGGPGGLSPGGLCVQWGLCLGEGLCQESEKRVILFLLERFLVLIGFYAIA